MSSSLYVLNSIDKLVLNTQIVSLHILNRFLVPSISGDLWGPLLLCTFMAIVLQGSSDERINDGGPQFAEVFVIVWIGSAVVTLNSKLLGGNM